MNKELRKFLLELHRTLAKPSAAYFGSRKVMLCPYHALGGLAALLMVGSWVSDEAASNRKDETQEFVHRNEQERNEKSSSLKGARITAPGCVEIARLESFTDEATGAYISRPRLMHDPSTGYVFLAYDFTGNECTFRSYYGPKSGEVELPVKWSDREVRAFRALINAGY